MRTEIWLALGIIIGALVGSAPGRADGEPVNGICWGVPAGPMAGLFLRMALPPKYKKKPQADEPPAEERKPR